MDSGELEVAKVTTLGWGGHRDLYVWTSVVEWCGRWEESIFSNIVWNQVAA